MTIEQVRLKIKELDSDEKLNLLLEGIVDIANGLDELKEVAEERHEEILEKFSNIELPGRDYEFGES